MLLVGTSTLDYLDLADDPSGRSGRGGATSAAAKSVREEGAVTAPVPSQAGPAAASVPVDLARHA